MNHRLDWNASEPAALDPWRAGGYRTADRRASSSNKTSIRFRPAHRFILCLFDRFGFMDSFCAGWSMHMDQTSAMGLTGYSKIMKILKNNYFSCGYQIVMVLIWFEKQSQVWCRDGRKRTEHRAFWSALCNSLQCSFVSTAHPHWGSCALFKSTPSHFVQDVFKTGWIGNWTGPDRERLRMSFYFPILPFAVY